MSTSKPFKKSTIKDVAAKAAVSVTTVSHVVSGTPGYSAQTVEKVWAAIKELNYAPSYIAHGLRQKATHTIGVCATDPYHDDRSSNQTFSQRLWRGILEEADLNNKSVLHFPKSVRDTMSASPFLNGQIDGLIMCAQRTDPRPLQVSRAGLPVVMISRSYNVPEGVVSVGSDEASIAQRALNFLYRLGHRRIAYVAGPAWDEDPNDPTLPLDDIAKARFMAYLEWMAERPDCGSPAYVMTRNWERSDLTDVLAGWVRSVHPTAVFCANDALARSVIDAAETLGIEVPRELSVIGIDDDASYVQGNVQLTTLRVPVTEIGRQAVRLLLQLTAEPEMERCPLIVPCGDVIVRTSTAPLTPLS